MPQPSESLENEFDKRFVDIQRDINGGVGYLEWKSYQEEELIEKVKSFLHEVLERQRAELAKKIEELDYSEKYLKTDKWYGTDGEESYDLAKKDVLALLKKDE